MWVESDGGPLSYKNPTIWTSPYTADPASIKRRKVAVLKDTTGGGGAGIVANQGVALTVTSETTATLTRLADGLGWTIKAETDQRIAQTMWVDDQEVVVAATDAAKTAPGVTSMMRLRRDALGTPDLSTGF